jgi:sirohydrochlorin cobaltochelatase
MTLVDSLSHALASGIHRIGQIEIQTLDLKSERFALTHADEAGKVGELDFGGLEVYHRADDAHALATFGDDGEYRFSKARTNLARGWILIVEGLEELRRALDLFYPAALGVWTAGQTGRLEIQNLRDKLNRQTGMYRFARNISDVGAQQLVREVCGPAHQCAKRILWQLDTATPLEDSEASRYNGIPGNVPENEAIPLLCREACNHFVAECRKASKAEAQRS